MRKPTVVLLALTALCVPAMAQEATGKTKSATPRTYLDTLDYSSGAAVAQGFVDAYASDDFFTAYYLLSPDAKSGFVNKLYEYNDAQLFPGISAGRAVADPASPNELPAEDILKDVYLDGATMFDAAMVNAHALGFEPFDFEPGVKVSATFEHEAEARYIVSAEGDPGAVVITAIKLSSGDWRVQRLVWAASDPNATPWGMK